jgi:hypothetical protein
VRRRRAGIVRKHFGALFEQSRKAGMIRKDISTTLLIAVILASLGR